MFFGMVIFANGVSTNDKFTFYIYFFILGNFCFRAFFEKNDIFKAQKRQYFENIAIFCLLDICFTINFFKECPGKSFLELKNIHKNVT